MKLSRIILIMLFMLFSAKSWAEQDGVSMQGMLATAKYAGACGILDSLIQFQKTTKMDGGDDFVARFWAVEAARLGLSIQQLSERCNQSILAYEQFWAISEVVDE